jgi:hypothetical protein
MVENQELYTFLYHRHLLNKRIKQIYGNIIKKKKNKKGALYEVEKETLQWQGHSRYLYGREFEF